MAKQSERAVVNGLIDTCWDAERGFRVAGANAKNDNLRNVFLRLAQQRREFAEQLLPHAYRFGGSSTAEGTSVGSMHRTWLQLRARLSSHPDHAVVSEATRGEHFALAAYDAALRDVVLPETYDVVAAQKLGIEVADQLIEDAISR